jgi:hypothetical protein
LALRPPTGHMTKAETNRFSVRKAVGRRSEGGRKAGR